MGLRETPRGICWSTSLWAGKNTVAVGFVPRVCVLGGPNLGIAGDMRAPRGPGCSSDL
jgi:hypothetical protein